MQTSDSLARKNQQIEIVKAQSAFDLEKKENQVRKLLEDQRENKQIATFVILFILLLTILGVMFLRIRQKERINRLLSDQKTLLEQTNTLLETQQYEIEAQRDLLVNQNEQLQQTQQTIILQKEEIELKNQNLEEQVAIRTKKLREYNRQLKDFAFITAHNLRTPVAQILGLGQLLEMADNPPEDEKLYMTKLLEATGRLDQIVKKMNDSLTDSLPEDP